LVEIKNAVTEMNDPEEIEKYFREILRKKQAWEKASEQLRTVGKRTEDYFRAKVE
jgi:elongation factor P--beta-lysine ligase